MNEMLSNKIKVFSMFLIVLVVFIHSENLLVKFATGYYVGHTFTLNSFIQNFLSNGVCRIAVPFYFIISGYLFFYNIEYTFAGFLKKYRIRFFSLFVPFLIWSFYGIVLYWVIQLIPFTYKFFTHYIREYSIYDFFDSLFIHPLTHQLWFIRDLLILIIISPVLAYLIKRVRFIIILVAFCCWFSGLNYYILSFESIFFFLLGSFFSIHKVNFNSEKHVNNSVLFLILWILLLVLKTLLLINGNSSDYYDALILKTTICIGVFAVWFFYDRIFNDFDFSKKKCRPIFSYSFIIYVFHEPILTIIQKGLFYVFGFSQFKSLLIYFLAPFLSIMLSIFFGILLSNKRPKLYKILTGNR